MIESVPKTFMPIQIPDLHRVERQGFKSQEKLIYAKAHKISTHHLENFNLHNVDMFYSPSGNLSA